MRDYEPEYHAYFVTFFSTDFNRYTTRKTCVVLAENSITAENIAIKMADKTFPNNFNSGFESRLMVYHDISPFSDGYYGNIVHFSSDD